MAKQSTTDKILNTALRLYLAKSSEKTTMEEIAKQAEIGRATIYRHFDNRDDLLITLMEREARSIAVDIQLALRHIDDPANYIIEGIVLSVDAVAKNDLFALILSPGNTSMNPLFFRSDRLTQIGLKIMLPVVEKAGLGDNLSIDLATLMEWIFRILISLITVPSPNTQNKVRLRKMLRQTLAPILTG